MILAIILWVLSMLYVGLIKNMLSAWIRTPMGSIAESIHNVSILVVFRNEAKHLVNLLDDISNLDHAESTIELILVDDDSDDESVRIINTWNVDQKLDLKIVPLIALSSAHKKEGLELGIASAKYESIVVTDADCRLPKYWLRAMVTDNPKQMRCGPVAYRSSNSLLSRVLELELMGLSAMASSTIAMNKPILANAANMGYCKTLFMEVGGYRTKEGPQSPSGDDIDLMIRVHDKYKSGIQYMKNPNALVETEPPTHLKEFLNQRIRWAGKTKFKASKPGSGITFVLMSLYIAQFIAPFFLLANFNLILFITWTLSLMMKFVIDYLYFEPVLAFYNKRNLLKYLLAAEIFHLIYVVPIAIISLFIPYTWKGRKLRHGRA
jgi:poly-beta-1,6-N-acetyl-D-glucosamine synthase